MRSPPANLAPEHLTMALAEGWHLRAAAMEYVPEGGGSYHWKLTGDDGRTHFVTVDDLDGKDWLGDTRDAVFTGLGRALGTAGTLRYEAGLEFVVAPIAARDGAFVHRVDTRYAVCVIPFLAGHSYPFGGYPDPGLRSRALDMIARLHQSTPAVRGQAPRHVPGFGGREDFDAFLLDPDQPWNGGPFSEGARELLVTRSADLARLAAEFGRLVDSTAAGRAHPVITHGEPHPANLMSVDGRLMLIDWDTAALAPPERDVSLIATAWNEGIGRYEDLTGRELDPAAITLYRLRWYLDDVASAVRLFRQPHIDSADTRQWRDGLAPMLQLLPGWLDLVC